METETEQTPQAEPEKKSGKSFSSYFTGAGILSYLRELSVVIIGILITMSITSFINNYNRQKDLDGMLSLVKQELYENLETLDWVQDRWEGEVEIFSRIREHNYVVEEIPEDALRKYSYAIGALYRLSYKDDSYDVLRNSIQAQYIKQKDLLQNLSYTYGTIALLNGQLNSYSDRKRTTMNSIQARMNMRDAEKAMTGSAYESFNFFMDDDSFRIFNMIGSSILSEGVFDECRENIKRTINLLENYGY